MKIALAAVGFITNDVAYNKKKIVDVLREYSGKADLVLFGETFLQGFDSLNWSFDRDKDVAVEVSSPIIAEIREAAREYSVAVSFGYVERAGDKLYSSQLTIGKDGGVIDNYRRISRGWRESFTDFHYCEGKEFSKFSFEGKTFAVGLCGDFWDDAIAAKMRELSPDAVLWPVYTDFDYNEWNTSMKLEYAEQAKKVGDNVFYVNSVCLKTEADEIARGGAVWFRKGEIADEKPAGHESVLIAEFV